MLARIASKRLLRKMFMRMCVCLYMFLCLDTTVCTENRNILEDVLASVDLMQWC